MTKTLGRDSDLKETDLNQKITLSKHAQEKIDNWLKKFPPEQKQSAVTFALKTVQKENGGWLTEPLMDAVADYLGMPKIAVYEVASFYSLINIKPVGKHKISVCTNISCMLCGSEDIVTHIQERLGIGFNETTADGRITLKEVECLAACGHAPVLQVGTTYHENLTPEKIDQLLEELK